MWWWNDYYWTMPWMIWPFMMFLMMAACMGMMFMMHRRHGDRSKRTIDLLNETFARGEITEAQYHDLKRILES